MPSRQRRRFPSPQDVGFGPRAGIRRLWGVWAILATSLLACGTVAGQEAPGSEIRVDGGVPPSDAVAEASLGKDVAAATLPPGSPPRCQFDVVGGVTASLRTAVVTTGIFPGTTALNLSIDCLAQGATGALDAGGSYELRFDDVNLSGPGTYSVDVTLIVGSQYYFANDYTVPSCTLVVDQLDPLGRGGMTASFSCPALLSQYEELSPALQVAVSGSVVLPAVVVGAPPPLFDAGPEAPSLLTHDAGAPNCTLQVQGDYETPNLSGWGYAYNWSDLGYDAGPGSVIACTTSVDGQTFALLTEGGNWGTQLTVSGETWCSAGCVASYESTTSDCNLVVLEDDGIGHPFRVTFECTLDLSASGSSSGGRGSVRVSGSFDGVEESPPPIK